MVNALNRQSFFSFGSKSVSFVKENIIDVINSKLLEKGPLSIRFAHQIAIAVLAMASGILLYKTITYFYTTFRQRQEFDRILQAWLQDRQATGDKNTAYRRIKEAFHQQADSLNLSQLHLNKLPPIFPFLRSLNFLNLSSNEFTAIPTEIGNLTHLQFLLLSDNQITTIPTEIGNLTHLQSLSLSHNQITTIPTEIGNLTHLLRLWLDYNQITAIPAAIGHLTQLEHLYLSHNQITTIPTEIGNLTHLLSLDLDDNQITVIPTGIGNLTQLKSLHLARNQITTIPTEIGNLTQLHGFFIEYNPFLDDLPMSLGRLINMTHLSLEGTQIDPSVALSFQQAWRSARDEMGALIFVEHTRLWLRLSGGNESLADQWQAGFNNTQKIILNEWLVRLERTRDFKSNQKKLASIVCQMMEAVLTCPSFADSFVAQVEANNACCDDRAAMGLNELYSYYVMHTLAKDAPLKDLLHLMRKVAKTLALRRILATYIDDYEKKNHKTESESVEIFLYYESHLKNKLDLLTAIQNMRYSEIGKRDWINEDKLIQEVNDSYLDDLIQFEAFKEVIKANTDFKNTSLELARIYKKSGELDDKEDSGLLTSEDYQAQMNHLLEEKKQVENKLEKQWFLDHC